MRRPAFLQYRGTHKETQKKKLLRPSLTRTHPMAWVLGTYAVDACNDAQEMYVRVLGRQHYVSAILDAYVPVRYSTPRDLQRGER